MRRLPCIALLSCSFASTLALASCLLACFASLTNIPLTFRPHCDVRRSISQSASMRKQLNSNLRRLREETCLKQSRDYVCKQTVVRMRAKRGETMDQGWTSRVLHDRAPTSPSFIRLRVVIREFHHALPSGPHAWPSTILYPRSPRAVECDAK